MRKIIVGVMGSGKEANKKDIDNVLQLGELIASQGWIVLSGGMKTRVMGAVNEGAKKKNGLTVGILPNDSVDEHSEHLDIPIITNMRAGRNYINALSCDVMVACGDVGPGTSSEISHAIQACKPIVFLDVNDIAEVFFKNLGGELIRVSKTPKETVAIISKIIGGKHG